MPTRYVAHRGGAAQWPENSLTAFRNAIALGARVLRGGRRRPLLVVPEAGRAHLALEPLYLRLEPRRVKGSPRAA